MAEYKEGLTFSSDEIIAIYSGSSAEEYLTITADRKINVPEESFLTGIEGDHNSNPVRFTVDRYVDGADLMECTKFYMAWENTAAETSGRSEMIFTHDSDDETKIIAIWLVDYKTCANAGTLNVSFQAVKTDDDGIVIYEWQTILNEDMYIQKGIKNVDNESATIDDEDSEEDDALYYEDVIEMLEEVLAQT